MIDRLPLRDFGLENIPAVPYLFNFSEPLLTLFHLARRSLEVEPAKNGLSNTFTIHGQTATAHDFLYGSSSSDELVRATVRLEGILAKGLEGFKDAIFRTDPPAGPTRSDDTASALTSLSLDKPEDFSISWTNFQRVYENAQPRLAGWADTLTSLDAADEQFWPTIADCG